MKSAIERVALTLETVKALPISRLDMRQPLLVEAIAQLTSAFIAAYGEPNGFVHAADWWGEYLKALTANGYEFLGNGYFAAAFAHVNLPGKVIKVGFKKEDSGAAYTAWCRANQGRAGVPVVHAVERHKGCYTVVMDKLTEVSYRELDEDNAYTVVYDIIQNNASLAHVKAAAKTQYERDLVDTAEDIRKFFTGIASFDIHSGNVMRDKQGNLVITDPVSFSADEVDLQEVDFDKLCAEIADRNDTNKRKMDIERGRRKHLHILDPLMYEHKQGLRKEKLKRRRKAAAKQRRVKAQMLNEVGCWEAWQKSKRQVKAQMLNGVSGVDFGELEVLMAPHVVNEMQAQVRHVQLNRPRMDWGLPARMPDFGLLEMPSEPEFIKKEGLKAVRGPWAHFKYLMRDQPLWLRRK